MVRLSVLWSRLAKLLVGPPVKVYWDDTDCGYTRRGLRREGVFVAKCFLTAWCWCQVWTTVHPRAATFIVSLPSAGCVEGG